MTVVYASVTLVLILSTSKETRGLSVGSHWPCHRQGRLVGPWWVPSCHLPHLVGFWLAASITPQCPAPCAPFPWDFPCDSAGKESACNAGDLGSIPGSGRSSGEGIGYPLQYSWASLLAQRAKNLLVLHKTWVWSLSWEDPLEEGIATPSSILAWRIPIDRGVWWVTVHAGVKSWTQLSIA